MITGITNIHSGGKHTHRIPTWRYSGFMRRKTLPPHTT